MGDKYNGSFYTHAEPQYSLPIKSNDTKKLTKKLRKQLEREGHKNIENVDERIAEAIAWGHDQLDKGVKYVSISSLIARIVKPR